MTILLRSALFAAALCTACSSGSRSAPPVVASAHDDGPDRERVARAEHAAIVAKHRELESAQQDALGATCADVAKWAPQHCAPSCYTPESASPRATTKLSGPIELEHVACQRAGSASWIIFDLDAATLAARPFRKRAPKPHRAGTWQADIEAALPKKYIVTGAAPTTTSHPLTHESLRCVKVAQYMTVHGPLGPCGVAGKVACEATGDAAARALNLVRYRLAEASSLHAAGNDAGCASAALDAVATTRGLPRWRQYAKLNVGEWPDGVVFKTRFDGVVTEDDLFGLAAQLGTEAEALHATCSGATSVKTTPQQEHAFHSCP